MAEATVAYRMWGAIVAPLVLVGALAGATMLVEPAGASTHASTVD